MVFLLFGGYDFFNGNYKVILMLNDLRAMLNNVSLFELVQEATATRVIICRAQYGARRIMCCRLVPGSSGAHGG